MATIQERLNKMKSDGSIQSRLNRMDAQNTGMELPEEKPVRPSLTVTQSPLAIAKQLMGETEVQKLEKRMQSAAQKGHLSNLMNDDPDGYRRENARIKYEQSSGKALAAEEKLKTVQTAEQTLLRQQQELETSRKGLDVLLARYQASGSNTDGMAYLEAAKQAEAKRQAYEAGLAQYKKDVSAYDEYNTAVMTMQKDREAYETADAAYKEKQRKAKELMDNMTTQDIEAEIERLKGELSQLEPKQLEYMESLNYQGLDIPVAEKKNYAEEIRALNEQKSQMQALLDKRWEEARRTEIMAAGGETLLKRLQLCGYKNKTDYLTGTGYDPKEKKELTGALLARGYSKDKIKDWFAYAKRLNTAAVYEMNIESGKRLAAGNPVISSILSVPLSLTSGVGAVDIAVQNVKKTVTGSKTPINYQTRAMTPSGAYNAIRGQVGSDIAQETAGSAGSDTKLGNLYQGGYDLLMSMADSLGVIGLAALGVPYAGVLLGGSAATNGITDAKERGATDAQALTMGLINGAAETFFENYSIDKLFSLKSPTSVKEAVLNILKQAVPEASEEFNTTIANTMADMLVMGDKSQIETDARAFMSQGMTRKEAEQAAMSRWFAGLAGDTLGGFLSGGIFGAGSNVMNANYKGSTAEIEETAQPDNGLTWAGNPGQNVYKKDEAPPFKTGADQQVGETGEDASSEDSVQQNTENVNTEPETLYWAGNPGPYAENNNENQNGGMKYAEEQQGDLAAGRDAEGQRRDAVGTSERSKKRQFAEDTLRRAEEARRIQSAVEGHGGELTSLQELGVREGSKAKNLRVVDREIWTDAVQEAWEIADAEDLRFVPLVGNMFVEHGRGETRINGMVDVESGTVYAQADSTKMSIREIVMHEVFHQKVAENPELVGRLTKLLRENYAQEQLEEMFARYYEIYQDVYSGTATEEALEEMIWEELLADAYAEFNGTVNLDVAQIGMEVQSEVWASQGVKKAARNLGGVKYSINETFRDEVEQWDRDGRPEESGEMFILGVTGDVLQGLGAMEQDIYMRPEKINLILKKHPEISLEEIKRIPEILEDPVLVLKSKGFDRGTSANTRLVVFGTVKAQNGQPIMSVLDLRPVENRLVIDDMQKVSSTYTRNNAANYIAGSDVLYADKNRTTSLLRRVGLHSGPTGLLRHGSMGSISYERNNVKLQGVPFSELISKENERRSTRYSIAGETARTADLEALSRAKELEEQGVAMKTIFRDTGWYTGADGKWRFEIDDSGMEYYPRREDDGAVPGQTLADYLKHDELFRNYPQLRKTKLEFEDLGRGINGQYNTKTDTITLSNELRDAPEGTLIHEVQHAIQKAEGFARGANTEFWERQLESGYDGKIAKQRREVQRLWKEYNSIRDNEPDFFEAMVGLEAMAPDMPRGKVDWDTLEQIEEDPVEWQRYDAAREKLEEQYGDMKVWDFSDLRYRLKQAEMNAGRSATDLYYDTAGEIEARDTARRRPMTAEERRGKMPDTGNEDTVFVERTDDEWDGGSYSIEEYSEEEKRKHRETALSHFGQTRRWEETGYLLTDGKKLDFSGRHWGGDGGYREVDHRDISEALGDDYGGDDYSGPLVQFMAEGNIRINPESNGFNLSVAPTKAQERELSAFIRRANGEVMVDIDDLAGNTVASTEYPVGTSSERVLNDIGRYFENGTMPRVSDVSRFRYSIASEDAAQERAERELANGIGKIMSVPKSEVHQLLDGPVRSVMEQYRSTGEVDWDKLDDALNEAWIKGLMIDDAYYNQYKGVKAYLRTTAVNLSEEDRSSIPDFADFRKKSFGTLRIVNKGGVGVDSAYMELREMAPELFPENITNPADQLMRMYDAGRSIRKVEVPLEKAMGNDADAFFESSRRQLEKLVERTLEKYGKSVKWDRTKPTQRELEAFERGERKMTDAPIEGAGQEEMPGMLGRLTEPEGPPTQREQALRGNMRDWVNYVLGGNMSPEEFAASMRESGMQRPHERVQEITDGLKQTGDFRTPDMTEEEYNTLKKHMEERRKTRESGDWRTGGLTPVEELTIRKADFTGTPALQKLGVRVDGSVTRYRQTEQLRAYEKAADEANRILRKRIKQLQATEQEKFLANALVEGMIGPEALNGGNVDVERVAELADYFMAARSFKQDQIAQRRSEINSANLRIAGELFKDADAYHPQLTGVLSGFTKLVMNERTPERVVKQIFGQKQGGKIYETYFRPVWVNGAELSRFENRMLNRVRNFADVSGKERALTVREREMVQRLMEAEAARDSVENLEQDTKERVMAVAENLNNGSDFLDAIREWNLQDEYHQGLAQAYADYLDTMAVSKDMDRTILNNAVREYRTIYDELYDGLNDFLVSHGYQEIGFIKGYAPHFQKKEVQTGLFGALKALGVEKESVNSLPADIAGRTADFKPNMKWNPHFQSRAGKQTSYDVQVGFEQYIHYAAEVLYHTDDVMRVRAAVNWFRAEYAGDEMRAAIDDAMIDKDKSIQWKREFLERNGTLKPGEMLEDRTVQAAYQSYVDGLFEKAKNVTKYSEFVTWMENYANIVAGKQSMADRGLEYGGGRTVLNMGGKLMRTFASANVAGNLSSVLNQTAQLPLIQQQLGRYAERALYDMARGSLGKENFAERSDFLTDKRGVEKLTVDNTEKFISTLFKPAELMDRLVSTVAVRGRYLQALGEGMTAEQAMKEADDFGRRVMGSRMRGAKPLAYESKGFFNQMIHVFQVEASNTFDYMAVSDMPQAIREIRRTRGNAAAARHTAAYIVAYLLNAFLLNRLTDELYGGTPAPFDLMGWALSFVANGWGMDDETFLKTVTDNGLEKLIDERPFGTEREERGNGLTWAGAAENLGYNVLNDLPYVRNVAGVAGLGDQSMPTVGINEIGKDLSGFISTIWNQTLKGQEETGLTWAGAAGQAGEHLVNAAAQFVPGGRQLKKTFQGSRTMANGGRVSGWGENEKLYYPVGTNVWNWARALLFGNSALGETDAFHASRNKALTASQTQKVRTLEAIGVAKEQTYGLYQDFRQLDKQLEGHEAANAKRDAIAALDLTDRQKLAVYMELLVGLNSKGAEKKEEKYLRLFESGVSWEKLTQLDNTYRLLDADEDMTTVEVGTAKRNAIADMDLTDWQKLRLYDEYHLDKSSKNYEKTLAEFDAMLDAGLSWDDITAAHNTWAELNADEELNATQKATAYAKWADEQAWNSGQIQAVKERYRFWQMIPAEASNYEKFTGAGLGSESADKVTKLLGELEPEGDKESVSLNQKVLAIKTSGLSQKERTAAIAALVPDRKERLLSAGVSDATAEKIAAAFAVAEAENGDDELSYLDKAGKAVLIAKDDREAMAALSTVLNENTYGKLELVNEYDISAKQWVMYKQAWISAYGSDNVSQEKVEKVLDGMELTREQKAALWQTANKSWKPRNNPYSVAVGEEIWAEMNQE